MQKLRPFLGAIKGEAYYIVFGDLQGITDRDRSLDIGNLNFAFLFSFVDSCWWWFVDYPRVGVLGKWRTLVKTQFGVRGDMYVLVENYRFCC